MAELKCNIANQEKTMMFAEAAQAGDAVRRQLTKNSDKLAAIVDRLRHKTPQFAMTIGRGSSDHACVFAKYLIETQMGVVTSPAGLSVSSVYKTALNVSDSLCIAISQSGKSPDLVSAVQAVRSAGAFTLAIVNDKDSPLAGAADEVIPLYAGAEQSVAATKSFISALASIAQLIAYWSGDKALTAAILELPDQLDTAWRIEWNAGAFARASSMFVLGRGLGYAVAREAALKFKETCRTHAEAYSAAEVLHGPAALIGENYPILAFSQNDRTRSGMRKTLRALAERGAAVYCAGVDDSDIVELQTIDTHPVLQPILMVQSFYRMANAISIARGLNPDRPPNLSKVTETV